MTDNANNPQERDDLDELADAVAGAGEEAGVEAQLQKQVEEMEREKGEIYNRLLRVSADFQNYMRRAEQNTIDSAELARVDVYRRIVPVLDHFDTALGQPVTSDEGKNLVTGMRIVRDELMKVLQQAGVERIAPEQGDEFDPHFHEAMLQQAVEGMAGNRIAAMLQPGYRYKERTIRPAKVSVTPAG
jgi:molecular chaperone GrpE